MLGYYWGLLRAAPGIALRAAHGTFTLATLAACALLTVNRGIAAALTAPSLLALIPIGLLFLYGLLRANYEQIRSRDAKIAGLTGDVVRLSREPPPQRVIHERKRDPFSSFPGVQVFDPEQFQRQLEKEQARKGRVLERLYAEYMEEHPQAERRVRLKTAPLPKEWVIGRLNEMGEWKDQDWHHYKEFWPP